MITTKVPRPGGDRGGAENNIAGSERLSAATLPNRPDNRAALRSLLARIDVAEAIRRQSVVEAIRDALPETWLRRARDFEWAGCAETAQACRNHARLLAGLEAEEIDWLADLDEVI